MMRAVEPVAVWLFWISASLIVYSYFLYPCILFALYSIAQIRRDWQYLSGRKDRRIYALRQEELPSVSLVIAAYNEQRYLPDRIINIRNLEYPRNKLEVIIVSDGSDDRSNEILSGATDEQIRTILLPSRKGKANALNVGVAQATNDILIFSDAATLFAPDSIQKLVRHFSGPKVGVVCGLLKFKATAESQQTEGIYWKYETIIRLMEARFGATLTASGAIYALRRQCFQPISSETVIEDFVVPMRARQLGYSVIFDPEATGIEYAAPSVSGEFTRRVRLAVGSFRAMGELIRVRMNFMTRLAFISHKLLRWLVPFFLIALLLSNAFLVKSVPYRVGFLTQSLFYLWAVVGYMFREQMKRIRFGLLGYFWLAMNVAFLVGFWKYLFGRQDSAWKRVEEDADVHLNTLPS
jgi:cellulose synthase/poly-beta-1,6-N-acetylglucosamine synthase-like glycosyltransferase